MEGMEVDCSCNGKRGMELWILEEEKSWDGCSSSSAFPTNKSTLDESRTQ